MINTIRISIEKCKTRPEYYEIYGAPTDYEIACKATQLNTHGQSSLINITPDENDSGMYWRNDGEIRCLAAKKLADEGDPSWLELNAIVVVPNIPVKALIISLNTTKQKSKKQRCAEAMYLIEQMPLAQGKENRIAPATGEQIVGRTNAWIGEMVGLPEYAITTLRSAFQFKTTDPAYYNSLLSCELDSWAEMGRMISNKIEQIRAMVNDLDQHPIYQTPSALTPQPPRIPANDQDTFNDTKPEPPQNDEIDKDVDSEPLPTTEIEEPQQEEQDKTDESQQKPLSQPKATALKEPIFQPNFEQLFKQYDRYKFFCWDSITMPQVGTQTVQEVNVSPPYWALKDYLINTLGNEVLKTDYIKNIAAYFSKELKRVLKKRGSLFLNIADTIRDGELQTIPQLLLAALLNDGWHLVGEIIWHKPKLPNNKGAGGKIVRLQHNTEVVYHLVQEPIDKVTGLCGYDYYPFIEYSEKPIPALVKKPVVKNKDHTKTRQGFINPPMGKKFKNRWTEDDGKKAFETFLKRCKGENEIIGGNGGSRSKEIKDFDPDFEHVAVMSEYLPVIPILECSKRNDIILDIFGGSGTVGLCAAKLDRQAILFDVDPNNVQHGLGEYAAWYKKAYGCEPQPARNNGATLINLDSSNEESKLVA